MMDVGKSLWGALQELPEVEVGEAPGLRTEPDSHHNLYHLANRRCEGCITEAVHVAMRAALAEGMTVAVVTNGLLAALRGLGYKTREALGMIRASHGVNSFKRKRGKVV